MSRICSSVVNSGSFSGSEAGSSSMAVSDGGVVMSLLEKQRSSSER